MSQNYFSQNPYWEALAQIKAADLYKGRTYAHGQHLQVSIQAEATNPRNQGYNPRCLMKWMLEISFSLST